MYSMFIYVWKREKNCTYIHTYIIGHYNPNLGGPGHEKRHLLMRTVRWIAQYAAPIWAEAIYKKTL